MTGIHPKGDKNSASHQTQSNPELSPVHDVLPANACDDPNKPEPTVTKGISAVSRWCAITAVAISAGLFSASYSLTKIILEDIPPFTIGLIRFGLASILLSIWCGPIRSHPKPALADSRRLTLGGILGITLYFSVENVGVDLAPAGDASLLVASYPAFAIVLESLVERCWPSINQLTGIVLAIVGVALIIGPQSSTTDSMRWLGDLALIASGLIWAAYNFAIKNTSSQLPTSVALRHQSIVGTIGFIPLALFEHEAWRFPARPTQTLICIVLLTIGCSILALGLYARGLHFLSPSSATNLLNLVPVFGLAIAIFWLGETVTPFSLLGGAVVISGILISTMERSNKNPQRKETIPR